MNSTKKQNRLVPEARYDGSWRLMLRRFDIATGIEVGAISYGLDEIDHYMKLWAADEELYNVTLEELVAIQKVAAKMREARESYRKSLH